MYSYQTSHSPTQNHLSKLYVSAPHPPSHFTSPCHSQPFGPDFWDSSRKAAPNSPSEPILPKLVVVGAEGGDLAVGPTHNLLDMQTLGTPTDRPGAPSSHAKSTTGGLWQDLVSDVGAPTKFNLPKGTAEPKFEPRPLNAEEKQGAWVLLAFLGSVWAVGGLLNRRPPEEKEHH